MSYQTYITDAIVVGSFHSNTADKSYLLFTERAGMLYANAKSVREERSRQRYALQDFSRISVTLVKGKSGWRIGSVEAKENYYMDAVSRSARGSIVRLAKTLRRYVQGEDADPILYDTFREALVVLAGDCSEREAFERCAEVQLLARLGYVASDELLGEVLETPLRILTADTLVSHLPKLELLYRGAQAVSHLER